MLFKRIIFVSEENTYTSPVAEAILKSKLRLCGNDDVEVYSCGTVVLFPEPANPKGVAIAKGRGIELEEHRARPVEADMFGAETLVLVMTEKIKAYLYDKYTNAVNVYTLKEFLNMSGDVETPYGKGMKEYGESYTQIEELVERVKEKLLNDTLIS